MKNNHEKEPEKPTPPPSQTIKENQDPRIKPQTQSPPLNPQPIRPDKKP